MLVIPENLVSEPSITRWELRALAANFVEFVGQRPARLFSSKSFQMVPNGVGDRLGLRLSGQPRQLGCQPLCFSVSDVERHNYMYSMITIRVANNVTLTALLPQQAAQRVPQQADIRRIVHVRLDHERVTPPAQSLARLFFSDRMAALHHQPPDF